MSQGNVVLPPKLYRLFSQKEHAEQFAAGKVRFGTLHVYREDKNPERRDVTEGNGDLQVPGESLVGDPRRGVIHTVPGVERLAVRGDPRNSFVYCLSACDETDLATLAKEFGSYCVVVEDPGALLVDLEQALAANPTLSVNPPSLEWGAYGMTRVRRSVMP